MAVLFKLLKQKWFAHSGPTIPLEDRIVIVTGSTTGRRFEAAVILSAVGASKLILGVCSLDRSHEAKSAIEAHTHQLNQIELWSLDMDLHGSIQQFAAQASKDLGRLDIVILNVAVHPPTCK